LRPVKPILIIENDKDNLTILQYCIHDLGIQAITSPQAVPVHEIIKIGPQLVLLDHLLDGISGGELCIQMKHHKLAAAIPVLLVSAHPLVADIAAKSGADDYLAKPFDLSDFNHKIRKFINN
jgi:DNA-binding response OmpR family regulator